MISLSFLTWLVHETQQVSVESSLALSSAEFRNAREWGAQQILGKQNHAHSWKPPETVACGIHAPIKVSLIKRHILYCVILLGRKCRSSKRTCPVSGRFTAALNAIENSRGKIQKRAWYNIYSTAQSITYHVYPRAAITVEDPFRTLEH